jgi:hypothetical protein
MTPHRMAELRSMVTQTIAQEARHLADTADYDQITQSDEEDEFIRAELRRQADAMDNTAGQHAPRARR